MAIDDRELTGQPAYFPGFAGTQTSDEPFFVEIEEGSQPAPPSPPAADAGGRPAWLPSPKRQAQTEAPRKPIPPVPSRPPKAPTSPASGGRRKMVVNAQPDELEEEVPWPEQIVRWIQGEGGAGFGISVLVHIVLLLILSLLVLSSPNQDEDLITTVDQTEAAELPSLEDVEIVVPEVEEVPQIKDPAFDPGLNLGTVSESVNLNSLGIGLDTSAGSLVGSKGGGLEIRIPTQAVTKGSFTVWTVPEDPQPGQKYDIMIQVKLKNDLKRYPRSDLSGNVVGTDGYRDFFGGPTEAGYLPIKENAVRYQALTVPGAAQLVKDIINVESKILKEKQTIELVF
jgi:hypothetical protein